MSKGLSVVICCHNSARRLPETLRHLLAQQVPAGLAWEVVVIDNASSDGTAETARRCWPDSFPAPLRVITEEKRGVAHARFRSFLEATYDVISFVDDDNWVEAEWVAKVANFFRDHPEAVAVGGSSRAAFEQEPPPWFADMAQFYAIGPSHLTAGDITDEPGTLLWAAGMSLRKTKAVELVDRDFHFLLCSSNELAIPTGEDTELCFALRAQGGRLFYEPKLTLQHFMPADRLTWPKALKLMRTMGEASPIIGVYLVSLNAFPFKDQPEWRRSWLFLLLQALRQWLGIVFRHPGDCLRKPEGSLPALEAEKARGRLATLWHQRRNYEKVRQRIAQAAWVRNPMKPPAEVS